MNRKTILVGVTLSIMLLGFYVFRWYISNTVVNVTSEPTIPIKHIDLLDRLYSNTTISTISNAQQMPAVVAESIETSNIELLTGHWLITYRLADNLYTDKLVIDQMSSSLDGIPVAKGQLFLNQGGSGVPVYCGHEQTHYLCLSTRNTELIAYEFELSNDQTKNGHIGIAQQLSKVKTYLDQESFPFSGYRNTTFPVTGYQSNYHTIQWLKRGVDNEYCLDILDDQGKVIEILHPVQCGLELTNFKPNDFVTHSLHSELPKGFAFRWRVVSRGIDMQGNQIGDAHEGGKGYEGRVVVD